MAWASTGEDRVPASNCAAYQCREHLRRSAGLDHRVFPSCFHADFAKGLSGKIIGGGADRGNADLLSAQIFESLDRRLGQNTQSQNVFLSADADELRIP